MKRSESTTRPLFTFIDLFSGIGGFHSALTQLGGKCLLASDINTIANKTYELNYGMKPLGDIRQISSETIPDFDVLCAGFPCQSFSNIGLGRGLSDPRGHLFFEITRILKDKHPLAFILENVKGLLTHEKGATFEIIVKSLQECGYKVYSNILNAKDFGLPQDRKRLFFVGIRQDKSFDFVFPLPRPLSFFLSQVLGGKTEKECAYTIRIGGRHSGIDNRFNWDCYIVNKVPYFLTPRDCLALQGFPSGFVLCGKKSEQFAQVGNAVPINVVKAVGFQLLKTGIFKRELHMENVRLLSEQWAQKTYSDGLKELPHSPDLINKATSIFKKLGILSVRMDGYSCEKLPTTAEIRLSIKKTYSAMFHDEAEKDSFSPASYLVHILSECLNAGIDNEETIVGTLARGLRTFASLLKEPDFARQLEEGLRKYDATTTTHLNSKQDSSDHTDVLLTFNNRTYRIWLYQFSPRGLPHDVERLTGKRGEIPDGIHLICPLHTDRALKYESLRKRVNKLQEKLSLKKTNLAECSPKAIKAKESLKAQIAELETELRSIELQKAEAKRDADQELDIKEGWFFYSKTHVESVIQSIVNSIQPMQYDDVLRILNGPENFVGKIQIFKK